MASRYLRGPASFLSCERSAEADSESSAQVFSFARYGLFATAKHVLDELVDCDAGVLKTGFIFQDDPPHLIIRRIVGVSLSDTADVAIGQADNGVGGTGTWGPANLRGPLSFTQPSPRENLTAWEYTQIPPSRRSSVLTFAELATYGHVDVGAL
jgi:hypothetical protein